MPGTIAYGDEVITYDLVRNPILSGKVRIHVHPNGSVEVEAPEATSNEEVTTALKKRLRWVSHQLAERKAYKAHVLPRAYVSGESHFYLGRRYLLKAMASDGGRGDVKLIGGKLIVSTTSQTSGEVKDTLNRWYRRRAKIYFERKLKEVSQSMSWVDHPPPLTLRTMRTQWGNCSPSGQVCINPRLIRAPRDCIEYVVTHELCHLKEHNHSKRYYALLDQHLPNWRHVKAHLDGMAELILAE